MMNNTRIELWAFSDADPSLPTAQILDLWFVRWFGSPGHDGLDLHGSGSVSLLHTLQRCSGQEEMDVLPGRPDHAGLHQAGALQLLAGECFQVKYI